MIDYYNLPLDDEETWNLICDGLSRGVFQLEQLGISWGKKLKPRNIEELAALIAIIRPGCLRSFVDDKNITQHYCDRKNNVEHSTSLHPALDSILEDTYNLIIYQESQLIISKEIAGFSLQTADLLRSGVGKKDSKLLAKLRPQFIEGCEKVGKVDKDGAIQIYDIIEKSARYNFNKVHSVEYATLGYYSAYVKAHHPLKFFCANLRHAKNKQKPQQEIRELITDAKLFDINVLPPSWDNLYEKFSILDGKIYFGAGNLKGVGESQTAKLFNSLTETIETINKPTKLWSWYDFLTNFAHKVNRTVILSLIWSGTLSKFNITRKRMEYEYKVLIKLSKHEKSWLINNGYHFTSLQDAIYGLSISKGVANKNRREIVKGIYQTLNNPPFSLNDTIREIVKKEKGLFGTSLTYHVLDNCDISGANTTCKEFFFGKLGNVTLAVEILSIHDYTINRGRNKGQKMFFLTVEDNSCMLDSVIVFSQEFGDVLYEGNTVLLTGKRSEKSGRDGLIISNVTQI